MANAGYTSPFPTIHDTIGQSTLVTPLFMPSSPPHELSSPTPGSPLSDKSSVSEHFEHRDNNNNGNTSDGPPSDDELDNLTRPSTPGSPTGSDLDARLAEYTLDFSRFPNGHMGANEPDEPDEHAELEDELGDLRHDGEEYMSDVGGPEDFTQNLDKYLLSEGLSSIKKPRANDVSLPLGDLSLGLRQPAVEEEGESGEYSEFGPPVDMSTPSHLLHRMSAFAKESTHLEDIEEDPDDDLPDPESPSIRRMPTITENEALEREKFLHERIVQLEEDLHDRDEQMQKNHNRVLEAVSAAEQIKHLQTELQRKNEYIEDMKAKATDEERLREQVESLEKQNAELELRLQKSNSQSPELEELQQQMQAMQQHRIQDANKFESERTEILEKMATLRQQLQHTEEQLDSRDSTLEDTIAKLKEVTHSKEILLQEKNNEIDRLSGVLDDRVLDNENLEAKLEALHTDHDALEDRLTDLETKNHPLEERNQSLEADLSRVQSQVEAQENALKAVAADLPMAGRNTPLQTNSTYSEILDLIKDLGLATPDLITPSPAKEEFFEDHDVEQLRQDITKLQQELQDALAAQKAADAEASRQREQATETQALIKTIEGENSRLTARVKELSSALKKTAEDLIRMKEEHAASLETVATLQEAALQAPTPPSPPTTQQPAAVDTAALEASHQQQIRSLKTAHSTNVSTLRVSHAESMRKIRNLVTAAEQREADLRTELTTLRTASSRQESQLRKSFRSEIKRLENVIADKDETTAAMDQRIALSVEKRESEWERRVDLLLKERDRMASALMMYWGENDMGKGPGSLVPLAESKDSRRNEERGEKKQGQAYRYKYSQKHKSKRDDKA
ncbi:hypothetical protein N7495_006272 [Penicillium taxi]|uniref:uncharacterized protein n=1 Tax=Penicillium taxi TaxID=168475 RepID=UPI002545B66D|nr:uncharacterized protein N7495_006272 [Penicillium taxi]KAJ5894581.1 hypothetical protein N7495_006272 [Penicillium taxi]